MKPTATGYDSRDLRGYADKPLNPKWPYNSKLAISFVLNYEEGGENTPYNNDKFTEVFLNETPGSAPKTQRDFAMETQYEYGSRCGFWRILRLFKKYNSVFTCYAVGKAIELNPCVVPAMIQDGHEVASHNYRWIDYKDVPEDVERNHVRSTIEAIKSAGGPPPAGWYTGRVGVNSRRVVWDEYKKAGLTLHYECDAYNDDLPYWVDMSGEGLLVIPYTLDVNDMKFCVPPGFTSPDGFYTYLKNAFDTLYEEGSSGSPKMLSIGLHCRVIGKPGRIKALEKFLEYVKSHDDVWVCTRKQISDHWRKEHPFHAKRS